ncbi:nucleotidyl transferase AbiEii/AbiGii toxin family protein [Raineyella sp.]|uniref:nucleotidyl transferase AbiEii/AbiGii toxin family protein n=1 Tax=Raineyella sp. TaxID=1911550 RepID=UPI002B2210CA|nr:nucleotidyl transferase AbiEii/AbiGii toxin family protein [Raineyella sp.]MEA5153611.1 nucleotidyl transferase AbiEii/AbiGii toxin family protein [Raineyella sp.]
MAYELSEDDAAAQEQHFGVSRDQVEHDFAISHLLDAISSESEKFVFYGGTALSRTFLNGLRLSEDVDLLSVGPRPQAAVALDRAIRSSLEPNFGLIDAHPRLDQVKADTDACLYPIGDVQIRVQLITGSHYTPWPQQTTPVSMRYSGMPDRVMTTLTPAGFACAKLSAWCDTTRNAPRDLYDLWAMAKQGMIDAEAAGTFKRLGATGSYPTRWMFPQKAPTPTQWQDSIGHQCRPQVGPDEAYESVVEAWRTAAEDLGSR